MTMQDFGSHERSRVQKQAPPEIRTNWEKSTKGQSLYMTASTDDKRPEVKWRMNTWGVHTRVFREARHKVGGYGRPGRAGTS